MECRAGQAQNGLFTIFLRAAGHAELAQVEAGILGQQTFAEYVEAARPHGVALWVNRDTGAGVCENSGEHYVIFATHENNCIMECRAGQAQNEGFWGLREESLQVVCFQRVRGRGCKSYKNVFMGLLRGGQGTSF